MPRPSANRGRKQHEQAHDHGGGAGDIGQHVREQGLGGGGTSVYNTAQLTGGVRVKVVERQLKQVLARSLADIGRAAKRRQVRAHEPHEISYDACQRKPHAHQPYIAMSQASLQLGATAIRSRATSKCTRTGFC